MSGRWNVDTGVEELDVRLVDAVEGPDATSGTAEVFHAGAWGSLCDGAAGMPGAAAAPTFSEVRWRPQHITTG